MQPGAVGAGCWVMDAGAMPERSGEQASRGGPDE